FHYFFFSSRRRHTRFSRDWSSDVCSSDLDFIALVERHRVAYHEKELGQLFCDVSSKLIVKLLVDKCHEAGAQVRTHCTVSRVERSEERRVGYGGRPGRRPSRLRHKHASCG